MQRDAPDLLGFVSQTRNLKNDSHALRTPPKINPIHEKICDPIFPKRWYPIQAPKTAKPMAHTKQKLILLTIPPPGKSEILDSSTSDHVALPPHFGHIVSMIRIDLTI